ncbi:hypothetical protein PQ478_01765 [Alkalihalophilus pseudofirmus]|uniref:hypothetical protein n=1 Tax=Alkalihalophilus pseudofirmus TaxID=79885 RepID=UPI00259B66BB|nr:hypothetical protein [Alkalihalophilus pseudofirmus]WEG17265.1 hypothetical protein PQ478_01765 [Alkalihalophilus pseudofirmus]
MNIISLLFGKPYRANRLFLFIYWFVIAFYFVGFVMMISLIVMTGEWLFIIPLVIFPLLFRIVYKLNTFIYQSISNQKDHSPLKKKWIMIGSAFVILMITFPILVFIFSDNVVTNVSNTNVNGEIELSIGSVKGIYEIEAFQLEESINDVALLPYEAFVREGSFLLFLEHNGEMIWSEEVSGNHSGEMAIELREGTYRIKLESKEAKGIVINLSLN